MGALYNMVHANKRWPDEIRKALREELTSLGKTIEVQAMHNIEPYSKKTPPTIKVHVGVALHTFRVGVSAGKPTVPIAGLLERGNKRGSKKGAMKFRHPVFGRWDVKSESGKDPREQAMHPYLEPAVEAHKKEIVPLIEKSVKRARQRAGMA